MGSCKCPISLHALRVCELELDCRQWYLADLRLVLHLLCRLCDLLNHTYCEICYSRVDFLRELICMFTHGTKYFEESVPNCVVEAGIGTEEEDRSLGRCVDPRDVCILN